MATTPRLRDDLATAFAAARTLLDQGRLDEAGRLADRLARDHAGAWRVHQLVAAVAQRAGRLPAALAALDRAVAAAPGEAEPHRDRARLLLAMKDFGAAEDAARRAADLAADAADSWLVLGRACRRNDNLDEAEAAFRRARDLDPAGPAADLGLGLVARARGDLPAAEAAYRAALDHDPALDTALFNLANTLVELGRPDEAVAYFRRALKLNPEAVEVRSNLAKALNDAGQYDEAVLAADKALAIDSGHAAANLNAGMALFNIGSYRQAIERFRTAQHIEPDFAEAHWNEGLAALCLGDYEAGWPKYEYRWRRKGAAKRRSFDRPLWLGEGDIGGKTILLHAEQGLGDVIQFVRFVPFVARLGARVVLEVPQGLRTLLAGSLGVLAPDFEDQVTVVGQGDTLPPFDAVCPLLSLPLALGTRLSTIPDAVPYLEPPPHRLTAWRGRLAEGRPRVGIAWSGRPAHSNDRHRSMPFAALAPVLSLSDIDFYVVQKEKRDGDREAIKRAPRLADPSGELADFADTAALVSLMDLVISVDTSLAHLAGALARPVWVLLPYSPDWRWQRDRADSPWYPSMRLFRQERPGDWAPVVDTVVAALGPELAGR